MPTLSQPPEPLVAADAAVTEAVLRAIAYTPTEHLHALVHPRFVDRLTDRDFMRVGTYLARKSFDEGGCPIGGVIVGHTADLHDEDPLRRQLAGARRYIAGKGHNTLGQQNDPTTHGETAALRDAGRFAQFRGRGAVDFRPMWMYTTLTPCPVCCAQICHRANFARVIIGDATNAPSTAALLKQPNAEQNRGEVGEVVILKDDDAVALYAHYAGRRRRLHLLDWGGHRTLDAHGG
jgi:cytosine deaminase